MSVAERFGGVDTPAALGGLFAALGMLAFLGALIAATSIPFQLNALDNEGNLQELAWGGIIVAALVVFAAFFFGGWVAGRMARFNGVMNGVGVGLWMLLLMAVSAAAGAFIEERYNILQPASLPDWFTQFRVEDLTTVAIVGGILGLLAIFLGAALGGSVGESYTREVDDALTDRATVVETEVEKTF
jgi:amino acid transporter